MTALKKTIKTTTSKRAQDKPLESDFFKRSWEENWTYSEILAVADKIVDHSKRLEAKLTKRIDILEFDIIKLTKEVDSQKSR